MLASYLLLVGIAGTFASPVLLDEQSVEERIVGGMTGRIEDHPYLVSVRLDESHICGGTIISQAWVISAAHCFTQATNRYSIRAGSTRRNAGGSIHAVSRYVKHPSNGQPRPFSNDLALLEVRPAFQWTNFIRPATLPVQNEAVSAGTRSRISGWGALSSGGSTSIYFQIADVPIVSQAVCRNAYGDSEITDDMLCAGYTEGGVGTCTGDSGGPLVINGTLFGATSWSRGCGVARFPDVYASIPYFRSWISDQTGV